MGTGVATDEAVREQAAGWAVRLHGGDVDESARTSFERWLLADERHAQEFVIHMNIATLAGELSEDDKARLGALVGTDGEVPVRSRRRVWTAGLAASVLIAAVVGGWLLIRANGLLAPTYVTRTGENRAITFDDGSVAYLNTRTRLKWMGDLKDRRVKLLEGEALFDVVHDPARPFRILLDNSEIRILGTRVDVYRKKSGDVVVTVLEGAVSVEDLSQGGDHPAWKRELHANESIVYRPIGLMQDVHATKALNAVRWRDGVLEIQNQPLSEVLDELSRYTDHRILMSDPRLAQLHLVGALSVRDVGAALGRIQKLAPVAVARQGDTFTLNYHVKPGDEVLSSPTDR